VFTPTVEGAYSRMFAPEHGVPRRPGDRQRNRATSRIYDAAPARLRRSRYAVSQRARNEDGRKSILHVQINGDQGADGIEVGGYVTPVAEATMTL
jgi:predicted PhzF superfamily epimerase YddE/YHI9